MEGLQEIASIMYKQWSQEEKKEADEFFNKLDTNRDGLVSFSELRDSEFFQRISFYKFNKFDVDGNGVLDANEIRTIYYLKYKADPILKAYSERYRCCNGCGCLQLPDFSCFFCLTEWPNTYDLCSSCYRGKQYRNHKHGKWCILNKDSLALLKELRKLLNEIEMDRERQDVRDLVRVGAQGFQVGAVIGNAVGTAAAAGCSIL